LPLSTHDVPSLQPSTEPLNPAWRATSCCSHIGRWRPMYWMEPPTSSTSSLHAGERNICANWWLPGARLSKTGSSDRSTLPRLKADGVAVLTLDNPPLNLTTLTTLDKLISTCR